MNRNQKTVFSALLVAIGMVLPLFTAQIKEIGDTLLPMHFPILLCGFLCGPFYGGVSGLILPFLRSVIFGMPPIFPNACWMACELATYGFVAGIFYHKTSKKNIGWVYLSLISAMLAGRIVWGIAKTLMLGFGGKSFSLEAFWAGGFLDAIPGIILQLILIPAMIGILQKNKHFPK